MIKTRLFADALQHRGIATVAVALDGIEPAAILKPATFPDSVINPRAYELRGLGIAPDFNLREDEAVWRRGTVSAFANPDYVSELQDRKVNRLILSGVNNAGAVIATARDAAKHFHVTLATDLIEVFEAQTYRQEISAAPSRMTFASSVEILRQHPKKPEGRPGGNNPPKPPTRS